MCSRFSRRQSRPVHESGREQYVLLVNKDEDFSLWPSQKAIPFGWQFAGMQGSRAECLEFLGETWGEAPAPPSTHSHAPSSMRLH